VPPANDRSAAAVARGVMEPGALRARLLGTMDLRFGEQQPPPLDSAAAEIAARLPAAPPRRAAARQRLAFLLWPDSTERQAHTNLRKVVHNPRRALPDADRLIAAQP
jgi:DNA-binding SARP family transcriptional activator